MRHPRAASRIPSGAGVLPQPLSVGSHPAPRAGLLCVQNEQVVNRHSAPEYTRTLTAPHNLPGTSIGLLPLSHKGLRVPIDASAYISGQLQQAVLHSPHNLRTRRCASTPFTAAVIRNRSTPISSSRVMAPAAVLRVVESTKMPGQRSRLHRDLRRFRVTASRRS